MMKQEDNVEASGAYSGEEVLRQLFHLKRYETPDTARMTRNKQNIMRRIRTERKDTRQNLGEWIEVHFPWFFAEPRYGVALLFVAFAGLHYMGINAHYAVQSNTGIYTTTPNDRYSAYEQVAATSTNAIEYPRLPIGARLFPDWQNSNTLKPVGNSSPDWQQ